MQCLMVWNEHWMNTDERQFGGSNRCVTHLLQPKRAALEINAGKAVLDDPRKPNCHVLVF